MIAVVGNKCDIESAKRKVTIEAAREYAANARCAFAAETSAKTGQGVDDVFIQLVGQILDRRPGFLDTDGQEKKTAASGTVSLSAGNASAQKSGCCK